MSNILFGEKNDKIDLFLIFGYFLLIVNKFLVYADKSIEEVSSYALKVFFENIVNSGNIIYSISFIIGILILSILTIYVVKNVEIKKPSFLDALYGQNINRSSFVKLILVFISFIGFFLLFFNLIMEWLTLVIDAPLVVAAVFFYVFSFHNYSKNIESDVFLKRIADSVENFIENFVQLFHSRKTLYFGITGLLVLHLLTDVGAIIIPYAIDSESLYYKGITEEQFIEDHRTLIELFNHDKVEIYDSGEQILAIIGYVFNFIGFLMLMLFPIFIWYILYLGHTNEQEEAKKFPSIFVAIFFSAMIFIIFLPVIKLGSLDRERIYGTDFMTQSILTSGNNIALFSTIAVIIFLLILLLERIHIVKDILFIILTMIAISFFGMYIFFYFKSMWMNYSGNIAESLRFILEMFNGFDLKNMFMIIFDMIALLYDILSLVIYSIFYLGGFTYFVISLFRTDKDSDEQGPKLRESDNEKRDIDTTLGLAGNISEKEESSVFLD